MDYLYFSVCNNHNKHAVVQHAAVWDYNFCTYYTAVRTMRKKCVSESTEVCRCDRNGTCGKRQTSTRKWRHYWGPPGQEEEIIGQKEERQWWWCVCVRACVQTNGERCTTKHCGVTATRYTTCDSHSARYMWQSLVTLHVTATRHATCDSHSVHYMWQPLGTLHVTATRFTICDSHSARYMWQPLGTLHRLSAHCLLHYSSKLNVPNTQVDTDLFFGAVQCMQHASRAPPHFVPELSITRS